MSDNGGTFEHLIGTKIGGSPFDDTSRGHTAADLLQYANPDRITVLLWANTQRVLFNKSNAVLGTHEFPDVVFGPQFLFVVYEGQDFRGARDSKSDT